MNQSVFNRLQFIEQSLQELKNELKNELAQTAPSAPIAVAKPVQATTSPVGKVPFSLEFFPAKDDAAQAKLFTVFQELGKLNPQYCSVTYGAGGTTRERTLGIVQSFREQSDTPVVPHISCIGDSKAKIGELLDFYQSLGVERVVALRGDLPSGQVGYGELPYAVDLVKFIRKHSGEHFNIKVAAYPEMHPQAKNFADDIKRLADKYHAGANEAITQFFYNADSYLYLRDALAKLGVHQEQFPIIAGIMPITNASNLIRFADGCGAEIPRFVKKQLADYGDDRQAIRDFGFEVVYNLCERLIREGVPSLHFYSMNQVKPIKKLVSELGLV